MMKLHTVFAADCDLGLKNVPTIVAVGNDPTDAKMRLHKELARTARDLAAMVAEIECGEYKVKPSQYYIDTTNYFFEWHKVWNYSHGLTLQGEGIDFTAALGDMCKKMKQIVRAIYERI